MSKNTNEMKVTMQVTDNALDFYIYNEVSGDYQLDLENWEFKINEASQEYFRRVLNENPDAKKINLYINSYGGSYKEAIGIYNMLKRHPAEVMAYNDGFVVSAASVIAMAADKIFTRKSGRTLIHPASVVFLSRVSFNADELRTQADELDSITEAAKECYMAHAGDRLTKETLDKLIDEAKYLSAEDCITYGLADELIEDDDSNSGIDMNAKKSFVNSKEYAEKTMLMLERMQVNMKSDPDTEPKPQEQEVNNEKKAINYENMVKAFFNIKEE